MKQTAESIEAEAAVVRSQLVAVGADIRQHADPAAIVDTAKASFKKRAEDVPAFLTKNSSPISMVVLGCALGAAVTGLFSRSKRPAPVTSGVAESPSVPGGGLQSTLRSQGNAALLSSVGVGLGYVAGMFVPTSSAEERYLGQPKAVLGQSLDDFLKAHSNDMKMAVANAFGLSRLSAVTLVGLAMLAEALEKAKPVSNPDSL
jgi:hypothetical protein